MCMQWNCRSTDWRKARRPPRAESHGGMGRSEAAAHRPSDSPRSWTAKKSQLAKGTANRTRYEKIFQKTGDNKWKANIHFRCGSTNQARGPVNRCAIVNIATAQRTLTRSARCPPAINMARSRVAMGVHCEPSIVCGRQAAAMPHSAGNNRKKG